MKQSGKTILDGLDTTMPDLDELIDADAEFDATPARMHFGVRTFALSHREQTKKIITFDARRVQKAADCIKRLPAPGEYIHMVVGQEFAGFDLLPAMARLAGASFDELWLTTLGFSRDNLAQLEGLIKAGTIPPKRLVILAGDFFRRADPGLWDIGKLLAQEHGFTFKSYRQHTKLILASLAGKHYVTESSANLRSCQNIENFVMTQSRELYTFHKDWIASCLPHAKS